MRKILIVEDDATLREVILEMLSDEADYELLEADNGQSGLEAARQHLPHLVLCDVMMPKMDGHQMLAALRQDPRLTHVPFIFLTALADWENMRQGMNLGADDYLTKPFKQAELLRAVRARLEKQVANDLRAQARLDELRRNVAYLLPHELRTPLSGILGYANILAMGADSLPPTEVREYAEHIQTAAERLQHLVENYLLYAELETLVLEEERMTAMRKLITEFAQYIIIESARHIARKFRRETDLHLNATDARLAIPDFYLKKIIEELTDNAFKFSKAGTPVNITGQVTGTGDYVLTITNSGPGMRPDQIAQIGAFVQFERKLREQQGSGMGLSLSKRLVELNDGQFAILSQLGGTTTLRFTLQLAKEGAA